MIYTYMAILCTLSNLVRTGVPSCIFVSHAFLNSSKAAQSFEFKKEMIQGSEEDGKKSENCPGRRPHRGRVTLGRCLDRKRSKPAVYETSYDRQGERHCSRTIVPIH